MSEILASSAAPRHLERLEDIRATKAKGLKKLEKPWRQRVGDAIGRCFALAGVSQKEAAALLGLDPAQIGRWIAGSERPQFDLLFGVERFRQPLVIAICELVGTAVELETVIRVRRSA